MENLSVLVLITILVCFLMLVISCATCLYIKWADMKLKTDVEEMAKRKGVKINMVNLTVRSPDQSPEEQANENCAVLVPNVGVFCV